MARTVSVHVRVTLIDEESGHAIDDVVTPRIIVDVHQPGALADVVRSCLADIGSEGIRLLEIAAAKFDEQGADDGATRSSK